MIPDSEILAARILIVDDVLDNVEVTQDMLSHANFTAVHGTTDPHSVAARHAANDYDLILLDLQMPGLDGFEVLRRLQATQDPAAPFLPVVALTAHYEYKERVINAGARGFIGKPCRYRDLISQVRHAIALRIIERRLLAMSAAEKAAQEYDLLTGLSTAHAFTSYLDAALASGKLAGVVRIDLDRFARINAQEGINRGDHLLVDVATRLNRIFPRGARIARLAGDEFAVAIEGSQIAGSLPAAAAQIQQTLVRPYPASGGFLHLTATVGMALPDGAASSAVLLERAALALSEVKQRGTHQAQMFSDSMPP